MGWSDFLGGVGAVFGQLAQIFNALFVALYNVLAAALNFVWNTLVAVFNFVVQMFQKIAKVLTGLWTNHLKPFFTTAINIIEGMFSALQQLAKIIQKVIQRIRDFYNTWIGPALTDFLDFISRLRAALVVFRILGFNWAKKLDADLAGIQASVTKVIQDIVGSLNDAISILQVMVDPKMIIREDFFRHTLFSSLLGLKRAVAYGSDRPVTPAEQTNITQTQDAVWGAAPLQTRSADGSTSYAPGFAPIVAEMDRQFAILEPAK
jgi:hypothetical protein